MYKFCVSQVIPPPEWSPQSRNVPDDFICSSVHEQTREQLLLGASQVVNKKKDPMSYVDYANMVKKNESELIETDFENSFWADDKNKILYSIDNNLCLFGENVLLWNLNKLTNVHSNIHGTRIENVSFILKLFLNNINITQ